MQLPCSHSLPRECKRDFCIDCSDYVKDVRKNLEGYTKVRLDSPIPADTINTLKTYKILTIAKLAYHTGLTKELCQRYISLMPDVKTMIFKNELGRKVMRVWLKA